MNILILHRIPYHKIEYHRGIDHQKHTVVYIGTAECLANIPINLTCEKIVRAGQYKTEVEVFEYLKTSQRQFDRIISLSEYELMAAAKLREQFCITGPTSAQILKVRNKIAMKSAMSSAGIKVPTFMNLYELHLANQLQDSTAKIVLKPVDGASSENVIVFDNFTIARDNIINKKTGVKELDDGHANWNRYELEEFVQGPILHIDGLVKQGKLLIGVASRYVGDCLKYAQGAPLGSVQIKTDKSILAWAQRCITAADIQDGSFHLEAIQKNNDLVFLEIANRVGGADVVKTFELATGVHLPSVELGLIMKDPVTINFDKKFNKKFGWFVFPGHQVASGVACIQYASKFKNHPFIQEWFELSEKQLCKKSISYQPNEVPIAGVVTADDSRELINFMQLMFKTIKVTDKLFSIEEAA